MFRYFLYKSVTAVFLTINLIGCNSQNEVKWNDSFKGGTHIELKVETIGDPLIDEKNVSIIMEIFKHKADFFGVKKNERIIKTIRDGNIIIQFPFIRYSEEILYFFNGMAQLELKLVDDESSIISELPSSILPREEEELLTRFESKLSPYIEILFQNFVDKKTGIVTKRPLLIKKPTLLTGEFLKSVWVNDDLASPKVFIKFNSAGTEMLEKITAKNITNRLALILDGKIYYSLLIKEKISNGVAIITGISVEEAKEIVTVVKAGAIPAPVRLIESKKLTRDLWQGS